MSLPLRWRCLRNTRSSQRVNNFSGAGARAVAGHGHSSGRAGGLVWRNKQKKKQVGGVYAMNESTIQNKIKIQILKQQLVD